MTPGETDRRDAAEVVEDALLDGRVRLCQPRRGYRVAIDPVLLAAAVPARASDVVLDVGTGTGAAALCLAVRVPGCRVVGLELQPGLARLAERNAILNGAERSFTIARGDLGAPPPELQAGTFDHAMANPPYLERGKASPSRQEGRALANVEGEADLADWIGFCARMVRGRGTVTVVHRADRLDVLLSAYRQHRLGGIVVIPLWPKRDGRDARRVLVSGGKHRRSPLRLTAGLTLHRDDGTFTPEAEAVLRQARPMAL